MLVIFFFYKFDYGLPLFKNVIIIPVDEISPNNYIVFTSIEDLDYVA